MKEHVPTLAMLGALFMVLLAIVFLTIHGDKTDSPTVIGLVTSVSSLAGAIAGKQFSQSSNKNTGGDGKQN